MRLRPELERKCLELHDPRPDSPEGQARGAEPVTEKDLLRDVRALAARHGWLSFHAFTSTRSEPGFPDLVLVHPHKGVLFVELKAASGRLSRDQEEWLRVLRAAGAEVYCWRPRDGDAIWERLTR